MITPSPGRQAERVDDRERLTFREARQNRPPTLGFFFSFFLTVATRSRSLLLQITTLGRCPACLMQKGRQSREGFPQARTIRTLFPKDYVLEGRAEFCSYVYSPLLFNEVSGIPLGEGSLSSGMGSALHRANGFNPPPQRSRNFFFPEFLQGNPRGLSPKLLFTLKFFFVKSPFEGRIPPVPLGFRSLNWLFGLFSSLEIGIFPRRVFAVSGYGTFFRWFLHPTTLFVVLLPAVQVLSGY